MTDLIRIAIADDHKMMRQSLVTHLDTYEDIRVVMDACNGKELLHKLGEMTQHPDVCLMDINMPEMNGYEATSIISQTYPNIKVLAVTMLSDDFNIIRMLQNGACGYICKDNGIEELYRAVHTVQRDGFYSTVTITNALKIMMRSKVEKTKSYVLNEKEILFLSMCCTKMRYTQIAKKLCISYNTIGTFVDEIYRKIHISSRLELAIFAMRVGITPYSEKKEPLSMTYPHFQSARK